jgi:hypothetical protein
MRSRWEGGADVDLDAPATISEGELKALRRRAGFGIFALFLALIAVIGLALTLYAGPEGLQQVQDAKDRVLSGASQKSDATPAAQAYTPVPQPTDSTQMQPLAAESTGAVAPIGPSKGGTDMRSTQGPTRTQGATGQ